MSDVKRRVVNHHNQFPKTMFNRIMKDREVVHVWLNEMQTPIGVDRFSKIFSFIFAPSGRTEIDKT